MSSCLYLHGGEMDLEIVAAPYTPDKARKLFPPRLAIKFHNFIVKITAKNL
jgi:hypothetical protein